MSSSLLIPGTALAENGYVVHPAAIGRRRASVEERAGSELTARLFKGPVPRPVIAFASVSRGEGVTRTVRGVAAELTREGTSVAALDGALSPLGGSAGVDGGPLKTQGLNAWRDRFDAIAIDCGSLEKSFDLLRVAREADGVVLVVEAGRTSKSQIDRAAKLVSESGGTLLGFVLNKRRYPIPRWLYRLL